MRTYGAAPKAECFVSFLIAANVFVITATKRLMSQKLRTMTQMTWFNFQIVNVDAGSQSSDSDSDDSNEE